MYHKTAVGLDSGNGTYAVTFADDLIFLADRKRPSEAQLKLEKLVNLVKAHYKECNLRINPTKCEIILFHKPPQIITRSIREIIKNFQINTIQDGRVFPVERKEKIVKYLGVQLDYLLMLHLHTINQLKKAKNAFRANSRLLFSRSLSAKAELYAAPPPPTGLRVTRLIKFKCFNSRKIQKN